MLDMLTKFLITLALLLVWFTPALLVLFRVVVLYIKLNKEKRTNLSYKQFAELINNLIDTFSLNVFEYHIVLANVFSLSQQIVLKIGKKYYSFSNNSLIYLFDQENVIEEKIKESL